jgi:DNA topoisomerase-1
MTLDDLTLDQSLQILTLPRTVGTDPDTGEEILAQNGRYGPYLTRGTDRRSLEAEDQLFTVDVDHAVELFRQPPRRKGQRAAASPGRQVGNDPASGKMITVRSGRFGPYVTDGETNASLRTGEDPDAITLERAVELLSARRERVASGEVAAPKKRPAARKTAKKATTKKK